MLAFSEIVTGPPARLLRDGAPVAFRSNDVSPYPSQMLCLEGPQPEPPYTVTVDVSGLVDGAGLQAEPSGCVFPVASWNAPHGPEPLQEWGGLVRAGEVALGFSSLAWLPPPGDPEAGRLRVGRFPAFGRQPVVVLSAAGTAASQVRACGDVAVWTETAAGGGASRLAIGLGQFGSPWARRPGLEAWTGARSPTCDEMTAHLAWSEPGSQGRRGIRTALWTGTDLVPFGAEVRVDPAADADTPALSVSGMQDGAALLAFLETAPGGVPQLRLATARPSQDAGWTPLAGSLNLDPQAAASAPGVSAKWDLVVAWVEGGRVLVRRAPAGAGIADLGPPVAFPSDGVHAGRSPQVLDDGGGRPSVIYVESGPEGDRIRARRWDGASWRLVATPANDGVPGPVGALDASASPLGVAWTEADGGVRIRGANF
jgi:hypothetical protein